MGEIIWGSLLAAGLGLELWAILHRQDATLTRTLRRLFRVGTIAGAIVFGVAWLTGAVLLGTHVLWGWPF